MLLFILLLFIWVCMLIMRSFDFPKKRPNKKEKMKSFEEELEKYFKKKK